MSAPRILPQMTITTAGTREPLMATAQNGVTPQSPADRYRVVRVEVDQSAGSGKVYVGDLNVSSTRYFACLSLTTQIAVEFAGEGIDPSRIFVDTDTNGTKVQVGLVA